MLGTRFEWDASKAEENVIKSRGRFDEGLTVFANPLARIFDDPDHSDTERRELIIGHSARHRLVLVASPERRGRIRIISARLATRQERNDYEKAEG